MNHSGHGRSIFARELSSYFNSPIAYIFIFVFIVLNAGIYMSQFFLIGSADMRPFFNLLPVILCVFIPAITMRLWAEERKGNTFEMLLTFPMRTSQLVLGKFIASFVFYLITLAGTLTVPLMLSLIGNPDAGQIFSSYAGAVLMGAFFLSVGIFISGLCRDQIVAFIVAMIVCFFLYLAGLDFIASIVDGWLPGVGTFLKANFSMTAHLGTFYRGVVDNRDILYFFVMTAAFLALNIFSIEDRLKPKAKIIFSAAVGVCIAISILINSLFVDIPLGRYDLTEGRLYTVTDTTKNILKALKAPVTVKLYISEAQKMPTALRTLEQDIKDRLDELSVISGGKLRYEVFHMEVAGAEADSGAAEETAQGKLQEKGIRPFQVRSVEQDQMDIKLIYSAISLAYKEKEEEIIPAVTPQNLNNLEYELVSKIYRMTLDAIPQVALVAPFTRRVVDPQMRALLSQMGQSAPEQSVDDKFSVLAAALQYEGYRLNRIQISKESPIPKGLKTLIVVAPPALSDRQRYEIGRFLHEGGSVFLAAQQYEYQYGSGRAGIEIVPERKELNVNDILSRYGVGVSDQMLMDESSDTISISGAMNIGPFEVSVPVKAPVQILVTPEAMNRDVSIAGRLPSMLYLWGSAVDIDNKKIEDSGIKKTVLFTTSKKSWALPFKGGALSSADVAPLRNDYQPNIPLAVLLEGQFPNIFEGKDVPPWPKQEGAADASVETPEEKTAPFVPKPGKLLVVGCFKMFQDDIIKNGGMLDFFINSLDALTLGGELINIRGHREIERKIKPLSKGEKLWYRFLTILCVPCVFVVLGVVRVVWRRKEKEQYVRLVSSRPA
jgi:ABC-type uncharacterized transport system involved in gliding motility auxiliary subunit/ABC-type transport system involved in multi-copper enzyme maturation permease subunit